MIELKQHNLRPYNEICSAIKEYPKVAYVSATGTGKTYVAAKYIEENRLTDKTIIIVPAISIMETWQKLFPAIRITTYQNLKNINLEQEKLIILDEMHHIPAPVWNRELMRLFDSYKGKIIGLTATEIRNLDNFLNVANKYFDKTIFGYTIDEAIKNNILPTFEYICAYYKKFRKTYKGMIPDNKKGIYSKLEKRLRIKENEYQIKNILAQNRGNKILVFSSTIKQIPEIQKFLNEIFPEYQIFVLHSEQSKNKNNTELENFQKSAKAILITVEMFNEGIHISTIDTLIMFRKTQSNIVFTQQLGRVLSSDNINKTPQIFDLVGNHKSVRTNQYSVSTQIISWNMNLKGISKEIIIKDYTLEVNQLMSKLNEITARKPWTEEETQVLRNNPDLTIKELMKLLQGRTKRAIFEQKRKLGLTRSKPWTEEENQVLRNNPDLTIKEFVKLLPGRTEAAIKYQRQKLGLKILARIPWTEEENQVLRNNPDLTIKELMKLLPGRTKVAIATQRGKLGLKNFTRKPWTEEEHQVLRNNPDLTKKELMRLLPGRTKGAIKCQRGKLELKNLARKRWTKEENQVLRNNSNLTTKKLIKLLPGRTKEAILTQRGKLGLKNLARIPWTEEETQVLRNNPDLTIKELMKLLPRRTKEAILTQRRKIGLRYFILKS